MIAQYPFMWIVDTHTHTLDAVTHIHVSVKEMAVISARASNSLQFQQCNMWAGIKCRQRDGRSTHTRGRARATLCIYSFDEIRYCAENPSHRTRNMRFTDFSCTAIHRMIHDRIYAALLSFVRSIHHWPIWTTKHFIHFSYIQSYPEKKSSVNYLYG